MGAEQLVWLLFFRSQWICCSFFACYLLAILAVCRMKLFVDLNTRTCHKKILDGGFRKWWYPQIIHFNRDFHYKPSILGETPLFLETPRWVWIGEYFWRGFTPWSTKVNKGELSEPSSHALPIFISFLTKIFFTNLHEFYLTKKTAVKKMVPLVIQNTPTRWGSLLVLIGVITPKWPDVYIYILNYIIML